MDSMAFWDGGFCGFPSMYFSFPICKNPLLIGVDIAYYDSLVYEEMYLGMSYVAVDCVCRGADTS